MLKYILPLLFIGCHYSNEPQSNIERNISIIDSLTRELAISKRICDNLSYSHIYDLHDLIFVETPSNVIRLGKEYEAFIGFESFAFIASNNRFVVLDSGDAQIAGDTLWQNKEGRFEFKFTPTKKGQYRIKGHFIMIGNPAYIDSFGTTFFVE